MSPRSSRILGSVALNVALATLAVGPATAAARPLPKRLQADKALVVSARALDGCLSTGRTCAAQHRRLQVVGRGAVGRAAVIGNRSAPVLRTSGSWLTWNAVGGTRSYLVRVSVAGRADAFTTVRATRTALVAAAGRTVTYRVRTVALGSAWSAPKVLAAPAATASGAPAPARPSGGELLTAGKEAVTAPAGPTPTPAPASTTASPATTPPTTTPAAPGTTTPAPAPSPAPAPGRAAPRMGVAAGANTWQLQFISKLGAHASRMEFPITTPVSEMAPIIKAYADAGVQANLLAGFPSGRTPTPAESAALADWAAAFGPGGSFWAGKGYAASLAVDRIEFGNEVSGPWHYSSMQGVSDWPRSPQYAAIAEEYGRTFKAASIAVQAANPGVELLAVADVAGREEAWMDGIFRAVPDFGSYVGGWVVHPYGPEWQYNTDNALGQARAHGAPDTIPLFATEIGIATDDGRCLSDNYGWGKCLSYQQAADTLRSTVSGLEAHYGSRLAEIDFYTTNDWRQPGGSGDREDYFGGLTLAGGTKGAYTTAMKDLLAG